MVLIEMLVMLLSNQISILVLFYNGTNYKDKIKLQVTVST